MDYLIKQIAFLSQAFKVFFDKLQASIKLPVNVHSAWNNLRSMLDSNPYQAISILNYCNQLTFQSSLKFIPSVCPPIITSQQTSQQKNTIHQYLISKQKEQQQTIKNRPIKQPFHSPQKDYVQYHKQYKSKTRQGYESPTKAVKSKKESIVREPLVGPMSDLLVLVKRSIQQMEGVNHYNHKQKDRTGSYQPLEKRLSRARQNHRFR